MNHTALQTIRDALVHGRTVLNMRNLQLDVGPIHSAIALIDVELAKTQYVDSEPAFPNGTDVTQGQYAPSSGMSLRDYFAANAMQGDWAAQDDSNGVGIFVASTMKHSDLVMSANFYYRMADAMLEARK